MQSHTQTKQTIVFPIFSSIIGILIPKERWQLIPLVSLKNGRVEMLINHDAYVSHDGSKPEWEVENINMHIRTYTFDPAL